MEVTQPAFLIVKREEAAHFVCDYSCAGDAKTFRITLHRWIGNRSVQICASSFTTEYEASLREERCQVCPSHDRVNLTLWGLQPTDAGLYFCQMERIYPPPYYSVMGKGTQLYVIGFNRKPRLPVQRRDKSGLSIASQSKVTLRCMGFLTVCGK
ncbi:UNVERIFIED_CONTAM: hypothetical protein K2H54_048035 [Gekko kuhli]